MLGFARIHYLEFNGGKMSRIRIRSKWLSNISPQERNQINRLTLKSCDGIVSMMREDILRRDTRLDVVRIFLAKDTDGKILGWSSVIFPCPELDFPVSPRSRLIPIYTYVMRAHRRKGIGSRLIAAASKTIWAKRYRPNVIAWDQSSLSFFNTCVQDKGVPMKVTQDFIEALV